MENYDCSLKNNLQSALIAKMIIMLPSVSVETINSLWYFEYVSLFVLLQSYSTKTQWFHKSKSNVSRYSSRVISPLLLFFEPFKIRCICIIY